MSRTAPIQIQISWTALAKEIELNGLKWPQYVRGTLSRVPDARARVRRTHRRAPAATPRTMSATAPSSSSSNARNAYTNTLLRFAPASAKESKSHQSGAAAGGAMLPIVKGLSGSFGGIIEVRARRRWRSVMGVWPCPGVRWRSVAFGGIDASKMAA